MTPLHHAASMGQVGTVELLISSGANVNATTEVDHRFVLWCLRKLIRARLSWLTLNFVFLFCTFLPSQKRSR